MITEKYTEGIAFIVIGRNEGWKLCLCLKSIVKARKSVDLTNYEILYIDSASTDDSVNSALLIEEIKVIRLSGTFNSAIARNVGSMHTKMSVLFFIDGDMEIEAEFLTLVYQEKQGLKYDFVSGQLKNYNYDNKWKFISNSWQYKAVLEKDKYMTTCGGIFLTKHTLWDSLGGMDNRFKRGQDLDFSLRMAKHGYQLFRKQEIIAKHHTISYNHRNRIWRTLLSGDILYSKSLLYRMHIFNKFIYQKIFQTEYSMLSLLFCLLLFIVTLRYYIWFFYLAIILIRAYKAGKPNFADIINNALFIPVRDTITVFGAFFFIPSAKTNKEIKLEIIRK